MVKLGDFGIAHASSRLTRTRTGRGQGQAALHGARAAHRRSRSITAPISTRSASCCARCCSATWRCEPRRMTPFGAVFSWSRRLAPSVPADVADILRPRAGGAIRASASPTRARSAATSPPPCTAAIRAMAPKICSAICASSPPGGAQARGQRADRSGDRETAADQRAARDARPVRCARAVRRGAEADRAVPSRAARSRDGCREAVCDAAAAAAVRRRRAGNAHAHYPRAVDYDSVAADLGRSAVEESVSSPAGSRCRCSPSRWRSRSAARRLPPPCQPPPRRPRT